MQQSKQTTNKQGINNMNTTKYKSVEITANYSLNKYRQFLIKSIKETEESIELSSKGVNTLKNITDYTTTRRALKNCLLMFDFYYEAVQDNNKFNNK